MTKKDGKVMMSACPTELVGRKVYGYQPDAERQERLEVGERLVRLIEG